MATLLDRLRDKGYVESEKSEVAHVFRAVVSRDKLLRHRLAELTDPAGSHSAEVGVLKETLNCGLPLVGPSLRDKMFLAEPA